LLVCWFFRNCCTCSWSTTIYCSCSFSSVHARWRSWSNNWV